MKRQEPASREVWLQRVERWRASGQSMASFARAMGVNPKTLAYWRWKLEQGDSAEMPERAERPAAVRAAPKKISSDAFLELVATVESVHSDPFELIFRNGLRLQIPADFKDDALRRVIDVAGRG